MSIDIKPCPFCDHPTWHVEYLTPNDQIQRAPKASAAMPGWQANGDTE